jgi:hypothetical protein
MELAPGTGWISKSSFSLEVCRIPSVLHLPLWMQLSMLFAAKWRLHLVILPLFPHK